MRLGPIARHVLRGARLLAAVLPAVAVAGLLGLGLRNGEAVLARADQTLVAMGLAIAEIGVSGHAHTSASDIFAALDADRPQSLLAFDAAAAGRRRAALPWVDKAEIVRELPDRLSVTILERRPYAVWQHRGMLFLIDTEGRELQPIGPGDYRLLPLVAGSGAATRAREILSLVSRFPAIAARFEAASRIADRRWNLHLKGGVELLLPERDEAKALERASLADAEEQLLGRAVTRIDMRIPGQMTLTPSPRALQAMETRRSASPRPPRAQNGV